VNVKQQIRRHPNTTSILAPGNGRHRPIGNRLSRRRVLQLGAATAGVCLLPRGLWAQDKLNPTTSAVGLDPTLAKDWLARWGKYILADARNRYCDRELGEELGWLVSPFLNGFYYGYLATDDPKWIELLIDWSDAWVKRGIKEPDGFVGWPKDNGASTDVVPGLNTDNMLGEAMALRPMVLAAGLIQRTAKLKARYGDKAQSYIELAEQVFAKWDARGCWREIKTGGVWVVPGFGIDMQTGGWTDGYERRTTDGFTLPANKQNEIARWLVALSDVTEKPVYRQRAQRWWQTMKSRIRVHDGKYAVWNYWDPAGPWDYKSDGSTKHWVGVHPNGGYYGIDVQSIAAAYQHALVFDQEDIDRLVATNRDFMWNQHIEAAHFKRIDGGVADARWKDSPGVLWTGLLRYDATLRKVFEANHRPDSWGGLAITPQYVWECRN
jgi:hypothetical protein